MKTEARRRYGQTGSYLALIAILLILPQLLSCGGGRSAASSQSSFGGIAMPPGVLFPAGLAPSTSRITHYFPALSQWKIFDGTSNWIWTGALGSRAGLSASMSNPFSEVSVAIVPTSMYCPQTCNTYCGVNCDTCSSTCASSCPGTCTASCSASTDQASCISTCTTTCTQQCNSDCGKYCYNIECSTCSTNNTSCLDTCSAANTACVNSYSATDTVNLDACAATNTSCTAACGETNTSCLSTCSGAACDQCCQLGTVNFYIDGQSAGSLDMSQSAPFTDYSANSVSFYTIATKLPETLHTATVEIGSGQFAFDGWRIKYKDVYYRIDASEVNTLINDTLTAANTIRDAIEDYFQDKNAYPNPASSSNVVDLLEIKNYLASEVTNPFTKNDMAQSAVYSGGDYNYARTSSDTYSLQIYGGKGTLYTVTPDSVATENVGLEITSGTENHSTSINGYATFTVVPTLANEPGTLTICCGASGIISVPATSTVAYTASILLNEGSNDIVFALNDYYGNNVNMKRSITRDEAAPSVTLVNPFPLVGEVGTQTVTVSTSTITVEVYVEPYAVVTIGGTLTSEQTTVNSSGETFYSGVFSAQVALLPGNNYITVIATDRWGNTNQVIYTIKLQ